MLTLLLIRRPEGGIAMTLEDNKAVIRRFVDALNAMDMALVDTILAPTYVDHTSHPPDATRDQFTAWWGTEFRPAFPDWHETIEDVLAEEDKVVVRLTGRGTHHGAWMGIAPTGVAVAVTSMRIFRLARGTVTDHWSNGDTYGFLLSLGAITPMAGSAEPPSAL